MLPFFKETIDAKTYDFSPIHQGEWVYNMSVLDKGVTVYFKMKKDDSGMWKIQAQSLDISIFESEMALNDAIEAAINKSNNES